MTKERKSELIAQLVNILSEMIEVDSASQENAPSDTVEIRAFLRHFLNDYKFISNTIQSLIS